MDRKNTFTSPQQLYKSARYVLLGLILLTVLNIALFLAGADVYFMSSLFTTYMMFIIMYKADKVPAGLSLQRIKKLGKIFFSGRNPLC